MHVAVGLGIGLGCTPVSLGSTTCDLCQSCSIKRLTRIYAPGGAIDLDEIATPEILDQRQVKGLHSGLCSRSAQGRSRGSSTAIKSAFRLSRLDRRERPFYPLPIPRSLLIGRCLRQRTGQRVQDAQRRERPEIVEIVGHPPEQAPSAGPHSKFAMSVRSWSACRKAGRMSSSCMRAC